MKDLISDDTVSLLQDCRLMRKDELQVSKFFLNRCVVSMEDIPLYIQGYTSTGKIIKVTFVFFYSLIYKILLGSVFAHLVWAVGDKSSLDVIVQKQPLSTAVSCGSSLSHKTSSCISNTSLGVYFFKILLSVLRMQDLRFSQQWCLRLKSFGIPHCVLDFWMLQMKAS